MSKKQLLAWAMILVLLGTVNLSLGNKIIGTICMIVAMVDLIVLWAKDNE